jgi:hypothetical protein
VGFGAWVEKRIARSTGHKGHKLDTKRLND